MTDTILKYIIALFIIFSVGAISGCGDDATPQNADIHFTNSTDKVITIRYRQEVQDPFDHTVTTESKSDEIQVGRRKTLTIQEGFWIVDFTVVYNNVEYERYVSLDFFDSSADYNVTLESLGLISNG